jgi:small subunit ribosomal protein S1
MLSENDFAGETGATPSIVQEQSEPAAANPQAAAGVTTEIAEQSPGEESPETRASEGGAVPEIQIELPEVTTASPDTTELDNLMMADLERSAVPKGQIVEGKIMTITGTEVLVDIGMKTEATVPIAEFQSADGSLVVAPGDTVPVLIESHNEKEGAVRLSYRKAATQRLWEKIEQSFRDQTPLTGKVVERVKGGLAVDVGIKAFMPTSQTGLRPMSSPESLLGHEVSVKVIKFARKRSNVVVSRKLVLDEEAEARKALLLEKLHEGAEITGRVKNLTDYGAFVDLGGMDGLLHITDMAWQRIKHPSEAVQAGQEVTVKVLKFDAEKGRVSLGLKQLQPDPWSQTAERYHPGDRLQGRVVSITDYGAFVEVEPGVEGLIHVSEMSWSKRVKHPSKIVKKDDQVEVTVLEVKPAERRLSLSLRETLPDPWDSVAERFPVGTEVEAMVRNFADFGAFVEIEPGIEGLIHVTDLSWTKKIKHPSEILKKGQKITASILRVETENRRISLGLKQLETDPWQDFLAATKVGDRVHGKLVRLAPFGAFVELREGVEGLCHKSEMDGHEAGGKRAAFAEGQEYDFRILRINGTEKKIGLSMKEAARAAAPAPARPPAAAPKKERAPMTTMAEAFSSAGIRTTAEPSVAAPPAAEAAEKN